MQELQTQLNVNKVELKNLLATNNSEMDCISELYKQILKWYFTQKFILNKLS